MVSTEEKMHNLNITGYVLFKDLTEDYMAREAVSQIALRNYSNEVREEPGYTGIFAEKNKKKNKKKTCSQTSKDDRLLRKNKTSEVKDFSTFLCMRGCKILGSLKLFLRSASLLLGLVSSFSLSWIPLRGNQ